jgi:hypothetical protein
LVLSSVANKSSWQETLKVLEDKDIRGLTTEDHVHRAVGAQDKQDRMGAGRRQLTWIWFVGGLDRPGTGGEVNRGREEDDDDDDDGDEGGEDWMIDEDVDFGRDDDDGAVSEDDPALRIEFCTTRARAHWWQEECLLLEQEMIRVERFWRWDASRWREREVWWREGIPVSLSPEDRQHPELVDRASRAAAVMVMGKRAYACHQAIIRDELHEDAVRRHAEVRVKLNKLLVLGKEKDPRRMVECGGHRPAAAAA